MKSSLFGGMLKKPNPVPEQRNDNDRTNQGTVDQRTGGAPNQGMPMQPNQNMSGPIQPNQGMGAPTNFNQGTGGPMHFTPGMGGPIQPNQGMGVPMNFNQGIGGQVQLGQMHFTPGMGGPVHINQSPVAPMHPHQVMGTHLPPNQGMGMHIQPNQSNLPGNNAPQTSMKSSLFGGFQQNQPSNQAMPQRMDVDEQIQRTNPTSTESASKQPRLEGENNNNGESTSAAEKIPRDGKRLSETPVGAGLGINDDNEEDDDMEEVQPDEKPKGPQSDLTCTLWLQKYAPKSLKDTVGNVEAIDILEQYVLDPENLPSLILCGPPGCGKTTSVHCLAREILGDRAKDAVVEINASDERGIEVVRTKIQNHCQTRVTLPDGRYKLVILDEMDSMTATAQKSLRVMMEKFTKTTRFALACNHPSNVIDPILSRCSVLRFNKINDRDMANRFVKICTLENISYEPLGIDALVFLTEGDLRRGVNLIQSVFEVHGKITRATVFQTSDIPNPQIMQRCIQHCMDGEWEGAVGNTLRLSKMGYSIRDIIASLTKVIKNTTMDEGLRHDYLNMIAETKLRMAEGNVNTFLQLDCLLMELATFRVRDENLLDPDETLLGALRGS